MPPHAKRRTPFGERLSRIRTAKGITQRELARLTGISHRVIAHYETVVQQPSPNIVSRITKTLGISADDLFDTKPLKIKDALDRKTVKSAKLLADLTPKDQKAVLGLIKTLRRNK